MVEAVFPFVEAFEAAETALVVAQAKTSDRPIVYANAAFESLTGYRKREVLGRDCRFLQGLDRRQPVLTRFSEALTSHRSFRAVVRNYRKDGSLFLNDVRVSPLRDRHGETTHFVGVQRALEFPDLALLRTEAESRVATLSTREKAVFEHLVCGASNKEIAQAMALSPRTVEKYRLRMQTKMGTGNLALLVRYGVALGYGFEPPGTEVVAAPARR